MCVCLHEFICHVCKYGVLRGRKWLQLLGTTVTYIYIKKIKDLKESKEHTWEGLKGIERVEWLQNRGA